MLCPFLLNGSAPNAGGSGWLVEQNVPGFAPGGFRLVGTQPVFAEERGPVHIFGGAALAEAEDAHQFAEPFREAVGEFEFQNNVLAPDQDRLAQDGGEPRGQFRLGADFAVQGQAGDEVVWRGQRFRVLAGGRLEKVGP